MAFEKRKRNTAEVSAFPVFAARIQRSLALERSGVPANDGAMRKNGERDGDADENIRRIGILRSPSGWKKKMRRERASESARKLKEEKKQQKKKKKKKTKRSKSKKKSRVPAARVDVTGTLRCLLEFDK